MSSLSKVSSQRVKSPTPQPYLRHKLQPLKPIFIDPEKDADTPYDDGSLDETATPSSASSTNAVHLAPNSVIPLNIPKSTQITPPNPFKIVSQTTTSSNPPANKYPLTPVSTNKPQTTTSLNPSANKYVKPVTKVPAAFVEPKTPDSPPKTESCCLPFLKLLKKIFC